MPALASSAQAESDAAVPSTSSAGEGQRESRVQQLIRQKQAADAVAARSASEAAAFRDRMRNPGRPQDYNAPEEYTRAVAEHAVREVGADMFARQAAMAQEAAAKAAQEAWSETTAEFRQRVPDFDAVVHNPNLAVTPMMADAIREFEPRRGDSVLSRQEPGRSRANRGPIACFASNGHCAARKPASLKWHFRQQSSPTRRHAFGPWRKRRYGARRDGL